MGLGDITAWISRVPNMVIREKNVNIFINKQKFVNMMAYIYKYTIKA